ncbi:MAG: nucleotidyltransferase family protein [Bacteroidia bacterium]
MKNKFYIASRLSKIEISETEKAEIKAALQSISEDLAAQQDFFGYCKKWKLGPWAYVQLKRLNFLDLLLPEVQKSFEAMHTKVYQQNGERNQEAKIYLEQFAEQGIDAAILKGNLLIHTAYNDLGYKKMNDFDMLVHMEDWDRIQDVYFGLDYIPLGFGWSGEKQKPTKFSHTGIPFISRNYKCIIGTQWGIKSPTSKYRVNMPRLWEESSEFIFEGVKAKQLSPAHNLLHLILHMGVYKCGIRDCMDVHNLLLSRDDWDEDHLVELFAESKATEKAYFTLSLSNLCSGIVSENLLARLKPKSGGYLMSRLKKRLALFERTGDFQHAYHDYFQDIEMCLFNFNLYPKFHQRILTFLKLNRLIFWPRTEISRKLSDVLPDDSLWQKFQARIKAPYLVFALIAEEIGWGITMMLFAKLFVDIFTSLKNYFVKKPSYFDYLKERGVDPNDILKAVDQIQ